MRISQCIPFCLLLAGCSFVQPPWIVDSIAAGNPLFDSSRLRYTSSQEHAPLLFEMVCMGGQVEAYLSLTRFRLTSYPDAKISFTIREETFEDLTPVHEGGMRLRLSQETTQKLIQALQEGEKIGILVEEFEEILDPREFRSSFAQFIGEGFFFQNLIKGHINL